MTPCSVVDRYRRFEGISALPTCFSLCAAVFYILKMEAGGGSEALQTSTRYTASVNVAFVVLAVAMATAGNWNDRPLQLLFP